MKLREPAVTCAQAGLCPHAVPALCPSAGAAVGLHPTQNNSWHHELKSSCTKLSCALLLVRELPQAGVAWAGQSQGSLETLPSPAKAEMVSLVAPKGSGHRRCRTGTARGRGM